MGNLLLGWRNAIETGALAAGAATAELPVSNLATPHGDASSGWQTPAGVTTAAAGGWFQIDAGAAGATWRAFLLARTNLSAGAAVRWRVGPAEALVEAAPGVALEFADGFAVPAGATFARASSGWCFDGNRTLQAVASGAPRIAWDPASGERIGLLFEPARTNSLRNPRAEWASAPTFPTATAPANWFTGTVAGVTASWVGSGVEDGVPYAEVRFAGTASAAGTLRVHPEANTQAAAASGETWAFSLFWTVSGGSLLNLSSPRLWLEELSAASAILAGTQADVALAAGAGAAALAAGRVQHMATLGQASAAYVRGFCGLAVASGAVVDITLRVALPQLEKCSAGFPFVTTPILPPAGAPAASSRLGETFTWSPGGGALGATEGAFFAELWLPHSGSATNVSGVVRLDDGTTANRLEIRAINAAVVPNIDAIMVKAGATTGDTTARNVAYRSVRRAVACYGDAGLSSWVDGALGSHAGGGPPNPVSRLMLSSSGIGPLGVRAVRTYAARLTDGQALALSGAGSTLDAAALAFDSGMAPAGVRAGYGQTVSVAPAEVAGRYCRCDLDDAANPDGFLNVALAYAGPAWQPAGNWDFGSSHGRDDGRDTVQTRGGQTFVTALWQRRWWEVSLSAVLAEEVWPELGELEAFARRGGNVLAVPDPDGAERNRESVYGQLAPAGGVGFPFQLEDLRGFRARISERL